ncbi:MAG TPA: HAD family hydrolase [Bryobacteraceae bacterium]|nr:HAD family hydrolase [Bryobacteraceae bacterium]
MAAGRVRIEERQHLIIDADDTLWENNIYFERAFDEFCDFLAHSSLSPSEVRAVLDEIETVNSKIHGYGTANFARNLMECYHRLVERDVHHEDLPMIMSFTEQILHHPIELIPGVEETLEYLSLRHDLTLFTKGNPEEQKLKLDRSGLAIYFGHTAIVKEKDTASYAALIRERELDRERSWMIGNSPKSDINPALEAGINAVFVPHEHTWRLEHEEVRKGNGRLVRLERFVELKEHF